MPSQQMPSLLKSELKDLKLSNLKLKRPSGMSSFLTGNISFKRRRTVTVGVDIQPGYIAAVRARQNGGIMIEEAAAVSLPADTVREGEVQNVEAVAGALRQLFADSGLDKHVRLGVANQRTVMRTVEVPPFSDESDLEAAVRFQAEDQVPMPLNNASLAFRPLGVVDTPEGARQRVLLVAAQRDMVDKLLAAAKAAGLHPESIDLSAFALIRSLYQPLSVEGADSATGEPPLVLHLNVGGLTNMAIAEGTACRFTRVLGRGLEAIAAEVAERRAVPIDQARELLRRVDLSTLGREHGSAGLAMLGSDAGAGQIQTLRAPEPEQPQASQPAAARDVEAEQAHGLSAVPEASGAPAPPTPPLTPVADGGGEEPHERPMLTVVGGPEEAPAPHHEGPPPAHGLEGNAAPDDAQPRDPSVVQLGPTGPQGEPSVAPAQAAPSEPGMLPAAGLGEAGAAPEVTSGEGDLSAIDDGAHATGAAEASGEEADASAAESADAPATLATTAPTPVAEDLPDVRLVLEAGVRAIAGEVRNSLDFFQAQEPGPAVSVVLLSGPALDIPGFGEMLEQNLGVPVKGETVKTTSASALHGISAQYLAIAAGLAVEEVPQ